MEKFCELEEVRSKPHLTTEEQAAESFLKHSTIRTPNGRYMVALPFKEHPETLGDSQRTALKRFHSLEAKLNKDPDLKQEYSSIIREFLELGHLTPSNDTYHHLPTTSRGHQGQQPDHENACSLRCINEIQHREVSQRHADGGPHDAR